MSEYIFLIVFEDAIMFLISHCFSYDSLSANPTQNGQTHSRNSSTTADELFECV